MFIIDKDSPGIVVGRKENKLGIRASDTHTVLFNDVKVPGENKLGKDGSGLTIAGALYVMFQLHRRASVRPAPGDLGLSTCIEFHRQTLERQRDALRGVGSWYLLPLVPGLAVIMIGTAVNQWTAHPVGMGHLVMGYGLLAALVGAVFFAVWKLNQRGADRLQVQIDEMTALRSHPESGERLC